MKLLDLATLRERALRVIRLPEASTVAGEDVGVKVRRVALVEYFSLLPPSPPEAAAWTNEDAPTRARLEQDWLATLPEAERRSRTTQTLNAMYSLIERAAVDPKLTADEAVMLGSDATELFQGIMQHSGWRPDLPMNGTGNNATVAEAAAGAEAEVAPS